MMDIREILNERILVLDGAMGTMIQRHDLTEEDFGLNKHVHTHRWSEMNRKIFYAKWNSDPQNWTKYISTYTPQLHIDRFYTYPYFEKNIKTLNEQRYVHFFENPGYGK